MESVNISTASSGVIAKSNVFAAIATLTVGIGILFVVGFLQTPVAHNAAHDTRHANGFPCH